MNFKYEPNTNPKHNFPLNKPLCLNVLGCDGRKDAQKNSLKYKLFVTYRELRGYRWCRLGLNYEQLNLNLYRP